MRTVATAGISIGLLALAATAASGQTRVQIVGTVLDNNSQTPIANVNLTIRNVHDQYLGRAVSDSSGRFTFTVYRTSAVNIYASRIGYRRTSTPVLHFDGNSFFQVKLHMDPEVVVLAPLEVGARATGAANPVLADFRHRLMSGTGHYITRADIERRRPMYVSDMLQDVPGVRLASSARGNRRIITMARSEAMLCQVQLFVDGRLMNRGAGLLADQSIDDYVEPASVEGIEVYRGLSTLPPEFYTPEAKCGVVAVWTRRGDS
jgi:hypothetical protein